MKNKTFLILKKELREVFRDKKSLSMMLIIPIMIPFIVIGIMTGHDNQAAHMHVQEITDFLRFLFNTAECEPDAYLEAALFKAENDVVHHVQTKSRGNMLQNQTDHVPAFRRLRILLVPFLFRQVHKGAPARHPPDKPLCFQYFQCALDGNRTGVKPGGQFFLAREALACLPVSGADILKQFIVYFLIPE